MCKKKSLLALLMLVVILTLTACNSAIGSGNLISETRQVSNFDRIEFSSSGDVIVTQGASESLSIETDDNVMKHVKAVVENGTLKLGIEAGTNIISTSRLIFHVGVDDLSGLTLSGSGSVESDRLDINHLDITVSGSGKVHIADLVTGDVKVDLSSSGEINLNGSAAVQAITISGSGKYLAGDVCSETVNVNVSNSGDATVCATKTLDSNISGSGSVNYYGQPKINSSRSGSGNLNNLGEK